jgi:hypothetical protein
MIVLIGCEESQEICLAFRAAGHEAYSNDLKSCSGTHPEWHIQGDVFEAIKLLKPDLAIFHPPCTYLTVTANKWLKDQPARKSGALIGEARREARREAIAFFMKLANAPINKIAIENPVGCMSTVWRKPDQIIQPFQFGHKEPKKTCLWLKGLPPLKHTEIVEPEYHTTKSGKRLPKWYAYADKSQGQAARATIRSKTFPGIAKAMAEQWGSSFNEQISLYGNLETNTKV